MKKLGFAVCLLGILFACKPSAESKLRGVDQFAGGSSSYQCQGIYNDNSKYMTYVKGTNSDAQRQAVEKALSAMPDEYKDRIFLGPIQTSIELTSDISKKCEPSVISKANAKTKASIFACPVIQNGVAKIYVDSSPSKIRSSLVRGMAYYLIEVDGKIDLNLSSPAQLVVGFADLGDVSQNKRFLGALEFLDEVAVIRGDLKVFEHLLPPSVTKAKTKVERKLAFFDPSKTNVGTRDSFASYFLAEMFDSAFCSDQSRQILVQKFPKTFKLFAGSSSQELALADEFATSDKVFALADSYSGSEGGAFSRAGSSGSWGAESPSTKAGYSDTTWNAVKGSTPNQYGPLIDGYKKVPVSTRKESDAIPSALSDTGRKMYIVQNDGSEIPTTLYRRDNQQYWKGNDGVWRQSNITTPQNGEQSVSRIVESPDWWQEKQSPKNNSPQRLDNIVGGFKSKNSANSVGQNQNGILKVDGFIEGINQQTYPSLFVTGGSGAQNYIPKPPTPQPAPVQPSTTAWSWANQTGGTPQPAPVAPSGNNGSQNQRTWACYLFGISCQQ
jgi:hypothetical protein